MSADDTHEDLIIQGLRARQAIEWVNIAFLPAFLMFQAIMQGVMRDQVGQTLLFAGVALLCFGIGAWRLARGSVSLLSDRLVAKNWNPYLIKTADVPLDAVHKINLSGPIVRVGYDAGEKPGHLKLRLMTPVAEELFDRLVEAVESIEANAGRVEHTSPTRVLVARKSQ